MKNWQPLVFFPALAMLMKPGPLWLRAKFSSSKDLPYILMEPVPSPFSTSPPKIKMYFQIILFPDNEIPIRLKNSFKVTLYHEFLNDSMKFRSRICFTIDAVTASQGQKIFHSFGSILTKKSNNHSSSWFVVNHDIEIDLISNRIPSIALKIKCLYAKSLTNRACEFDYQSCHKWHYRD